MTPNGAQQQAATSWPRPPRRPPTSRYTIDLEQHHRAALRARALNLHTTASTVVRALIDLVEDNPALAASLAQVLARESPNPPREAAL
jgi:hypothetical protein